MLPTFMVIDNFLKDAAAAREKALALTYDPALKRGNYPGLLSSEPLQIDGLEQVVSKRVGVNLKPSLRTSHAHCRLTLKGDQGRTGVHIDPCFYSGILYLSRTEDARGGTDFFRHRATGLDGVPATPVEVMANGYRDHNHLIEEVVNRDTFKPSAWERVMRVPMRFNRLILFSPWQFHNAAPAFGKDKTDGRLVQLMFFDRV